MREHGNSITDPQPNQSKQRLSNHPYDDIKTSGFACCRKQRDYSFYHPHSSANLHNPGNALSPSPRLRRRQHPVTRQRDRKDRLHSGMDPVTSRYSQSRSLPFVNTPCPQTKSLIFFFPNRNSSSLASAISDTV